MSGIGNSGLTGRTIKIRQGVPTAYNPRLLHAPPALTYLLLGKISKYQTKHSPDGNGCQTPQLHYRGEEAQIKRFCAVGQHHERQQGGGGGWQSQRAAKSSRHRCCSHCPPAALMRCTSSIPSSFSQAQGRWCRTAGTWFTLQGGRLSHSLEWAQSVWSPLSLLLEKYSALAGRAGTDITRHKPVRIPMRGEGLTDTPLCKYFFIKT